ncbi:MAG: CBS domain-containing protein [candidate division Zixibacteria bacterium]|nr:CBS domain-containing protein [candidate division Zixibacteria bacterium]
MLVKTLLENKPSELITIKPDSSLDDAMTLMIDKNIGSLLVLDDDKILQGILSDRDIFKSVYKTKGEYHSLKIKDVMTSAVISGKLTDEVTNIAWVMQKNYIRHIPIVDEGNVVGLVSQRDVLKYEVEHRKLENRYLQQHMDGVYARDRSADL